MIKEFEPMYSDTQTAEFTQWDYTQSTSDEPIVDEATKLNNQMEELQEQARQKGYQEGLKQAQEEINSKKDELAQWISLLQKPIQLMDENLVNDIVETVTWLCKTCIGIELSVNPEKIKQVFESALEELPTLKSDKSFAMNPEDIEWLEKELNKEQLAELKEFLVADSELGRGDFYLRSHDSELDGRIATRLATIFEQYIKKSDFQPEDKSAS